MPNSNDLPKQVDLYNRAENINTNLDSAITTLRLITSRLNGSDGPEGECRPVSPSLDSTLSVSEDHSRTIVNLTNYILNLVGVTGHDYEPEDSSSVKHAMKAR